MPASTFQQQKLRVCEVCSAYLGLHDNDRRLADHFGGKLHLGFIEIREKLEKLRVSRTEQPFVRNRWFWSRVTWISSAFFCFGQKAVMEKQEKMRTRRREEREKEERERQWEMEREREREREREWERERDRERERRR